MDEYEDTLEFWDAQANFLYRYHVPGEEQLKAVTPRSFIFIKQNADLQKGSLMNPSIVFRKLPQSSQSHTNPKEF